MLAIGIALQNFPEGAAVSLPLRRDGYSCRHSFFFGQLSGAVEPLAGILGALLAIRVRAALPLLLSLSRRRHGDGHLGGASAGMPKMPAAASDGSRDAGGLCPHDGIGYDGVSDLGALPQTPARDAVSDSAKGLRPSRHPFAAVMQFSSSCCWVIAARSASSPHTLPGTPRLPASPLTHPPQRSGSATAHS